MAKVRSQEVVPGLNTVEYEFARRHTSKSYQSAQADRRPRDNWCRALASSGQAWMNRGGLDKEFADS